MSDSLSADKCTTFVLVEVKTRPTLLLIAQTVNRRTLLDYFLADESV